MRDEALRASGLFAFEGTVSGVGSWYVVQVGQKDAP